jgi:hypothetical protein
MPKKKYTDRSEVYDVTPNLAMEALETLDHMKAAGHVIQDNGLCEPDCAACGPYRTTPEIEYQKLLSSVKLEALSRPKGSLLKSTFSVNRTRLQQLAKHPKAKVGRAIDTKETPAIVHFTMPLAKDHDVEVYVTGLRPMATQPQHTKPPTKEEPDAADP